MVLRLAGEAGQVTLARSAEAVGARASIDQHEAEVRDVLTGDGRTLTASALLSYAQGFMEAAIARGWWPPHRRGVADGSARADGPLLDWESLRLAAVCRMLIEAQGLGI